MDKRWFKNLINIQDNGIVGRCPKCSSENTDYTTRIVDEETSIGYGVVWCNDCKSSLYISRMTVAKDKWSEKEFPKDIDFLK